MRKDGFLCEGVFEVSESFLLDFTPLPGGVFTYKVNKGTCCLGEIFDEVMVIISKSEEFVDTFDIDRDVSRLDYVNLFLRHVDTLI